MERFQAIWQLHSDKPCRARALTYFMVLCTAAILWSSGIFGRDIARSVTAGGWHLALFSVLMLGPESLPVHLLRDKGRLSVSFAVVFVSAIAFGPVAGALVGGVGGMLANFIDGKNFGVVLFNTVQISLSAWLAGQAWVQLTGGHGQFIMFPEHTVALVAAAGVYLAANATLCALATRLTYRLRAQTAWSDDVRSALPHTLVVSVLGVLMLFLYQSAAGVAGVILLCLLLLVVRFFFRRCAALQASHVDTIQSLAKALDSKDHYTNGHSERVADLAVQIARSLEFGESDLEAVYCAGLLHDIGKIAIDNAILNKAGRLTADELAVIRTHPSVGADIVRPVCFPVGVSEMVRHHHEWYDGTGYPAGLQKGSIPLGARILSVADAFDAMTMDRVYRPGRDVAEAVEQLIDGKGTQFDPDIVDVFVNAVLPKLHRQKRSNHAAQATY